MGIDTAEGAESEKCNKIYEQTKVERRQP